MPQKKFGGSAMAVDDGSEADDEKILNPDKHSRSFAYNKGQERYGATDKRPTNQNKKKVQKNVVGYMNRIPKAEMVSTMMRFIEGVEKGLPLSEMDGGLGMDMAHAISANEIRALIILYYNMHNRAEDPAEMKRLRNSIKNWLSGFLTTGAEDNGEMRSRAKRGLKSKSVREKLMLADLLLARANRTRGNLFGANKSRNRSIGKHRDIPRQRNKKIVPHVNKRIEAMRQAYKDLGVSMPAKYMEKKDQAGKPITSSTDYYFGGK